MIAPRIKRLTAAFSIILFTASLFLKAYAGETHRTDMYGYMAALYGPIALYYNKFAIIAWLANFTFIITIVTNLLNRAYLTGVLLGIVSFAFSVCCLFVTKLLIDEGGREEPASASTGAYIWIFSMFVMLAASLIPVKRKQANG